MSLPFPLPLELEPLELPEPDEPPELPPEPLPEPLELEEPPEFPLPFPLPLPFPFPLPLELEPLELPEPLELLVAPPVAPVSAPSAMARLVLSGWVLPEEDADDTAPLSPSRRMVAREVIVRPPRYIGLESQEAFSNGNWTETATLWPGVASPGAGEVEISASAIACSSK